MNGRGGISKRRRITRTRRRRRTHDSCAGDVRPFTWPLGPDYPTNDEPPLSAGFITPYLDNTRSRAGRADTMRNMVPFGSALLQEDAISAFEALTNPQLDAELSADPTQLEFRRHQIHPVPPVPPTPPFPPPPAVAPLAYDNPGTQSQSSLVAFTHGSVASCAVILASTRITEHTSTRLRRASFLIQAHWPPFIHPDVLPAPGADMNAVPLQLSAVTSPTLSLLPRGIIAPARLPPCAYHTIRAGRHRSSLRRRRRNGCWRITRRRRRSE